MLCRFVTLTAVLLLACTGAQGPQGPQGDKGDQGIQGPPGTFSGTFTGNVTFTGNATITGTVSASNVLATEAFTGWLTNAADFTGPAGGAYTKLKYTDVRQNSDPTVFRPELDGSLTILKAGVVNLTASFDTIGPGNYVQAEIFLNANSVAYALTPCNGANWAQVSVSSNWKVSAGDVFSVQAIPAQITSMDNGRASPLSVQWTGVP